MSPPRKTSRPPERGPDDVRPEVGSQSEQEREWLADVAQLSFQEARTALELSLAQLQAADLEVEAMAGHYRRALTYLERCESVLAQVEQDVIEWDPDRQAPSNSLP